MSSLPNAFKSVFDGMTSARSAFPTFPIMAPSWPLLRLATSAPAGRTSGEQLASIVECEIIPRLMLAHQSPVVADYATAESEPVRDAAIDAEATEAFARMVLSRAPEALTLFIEALMTNGGSEKSIYADLLTPAARLMGDLWDQDRLSYTEVTIGLGRLQQLMRSLDWLTPYNGENDPKSRSVLFSPRPGEQQTFGFYIMEELFRWSGWRAWIETCSTTAQMVSNVQFRWFDMFCLSVCRDTDIEDVAANIKAIRRASRNQDLYIVVYGRPFVEHAELVERVAADAAASCAREALDMADKAVLQGV